MSQRTASCKTKLLSFRASKAIFLLKPMSKIDCRASGSLFSSPVCSAPLCRLALLPPIFAGVRDPLFFGATSRLSRPPLPCPPRLPVGSLFSSSFFSSPPAGVVASASQAPLP